MVLSANVQAFPRSGSAAPSVKHCTAVRVPSLKDVKLIAVLKAPDEGQVHLYCECSAPL